jgi:hypothetical protein
MGGDDVWMKRQLDAAIRAMDYSFTDRARFSTQFGLVKRGYTIDTWDFQIDDATTRIFPRWGTLLVDPDRSKFGVMFGDNTGYAASSGYLAEMLERGGRPRDAARFREREKDVRERLDRVAWLGTHFRHWVPEDETVVRAVGVNEREQVSLSNTYSLNQWPSRARSTARSTPCSASPSPTSRSTSRRPRSPSAGRTTGRPRPSSTGSSRAWRRLARWTHRGRQ